MSIFGLAGLLRVRTFREETAAAELGAAERPRRALFHSRSLSFASSTARCHRVLAAVPPTLSSAATVVQVGAREPDSASETVLRPRPQVAAMSRTPVNPASASRSRSR